MHAVHVKDVVLIHVILKKIKGKVMENTKIRKRRNFNKLDFINIKIELKNKLMAELNNFLKKEGFLNNKGTFLENN